MKDTRYIAPIVYILMVVFSLLIVYELHDFQVSMRVYMYLLLMLLGTLILGGLIIYVPSGMRKKETLQHFSPEEEQTAIEPEEESPEQMDPDKDLSERISRFLSKLPDDDSIQFAVSLLKELAREFQAVQGLYFSLDAKKELFTKIADYAYFSEIPPREFSEGETISGQVAKNKLVLKIADIPEGYISVLSGLGSSSPSFLVIIPLLDGNRTIGIVELAFFREPQEPEMWFFERLSFEAGSRAAKFMKEQTSRNAT
jgi:hypothetical protein